MSHSQEVVTLAYVCPRGSAGKGRGCPYRRNTGRGFHPWGGKIPWSGKWRPTPAFLPGASRGQGIQSTESQRVRPNCARARLQTHSVKKKLINRSISGGKESPRTDGRAGSREEVDDLVHPLNSSSGPSRDQRDEDGF